VAVLPRVLVLIFGLMFLGCHRQGGYGDVEHSRHRFSAGGGGPGEEG